MALFARRPSLADFEREALPHLGALHGAALRLTRSESDAEDLVQETILRAYRFFSSFEPGTNCKAWLFRILNNVFCNKYRQREREQEILEEVEASDANLGEFVGPVPRDAESALLGHVVSGEVERALAAVPTDFRMAVILADLEDFSYREIAEIMECPAGTVMSRLYRGRKILQRLLYDYAVHAGIVTPGKDAASGGEVAPAPDATPGAGAGTGAGTIDLASYRQKKHHTGGGRA
jgi:RNA polymerase sigma-70 factor (ECF subfamily)